MSGNPGGLEGDTKWNREVGAFRTQARIHKDFNAEWFHDPSESSGRFSRPDLLGKSFPLARTSEEPDTQGDYILFTHPATWLRDLDPFCREAMVLGAAAEGRDRYRYGVKLSARIPIDHVHTYLGFRSYDPRQIRITWNGIELQGP